MMGVDDGVEVSPFGGDTQQSLKKKESLFLRMSWNIVLKMQHYRFEIV